MLLLVVSNHLRAFFTSGKWEFGCGPTRRNGKEEQLHFIPFLGNTSDTKRKVLTTCASRILFSLSFLRISSCRWPCRKRESTGKTRSRANDVEIMPVAASLKRVATQTRARFCRMSSSMQPTPPYLDRYPSSPASKCIDHLHYSRNERSA